ncbi:uncharacterized protein LOC116840360 [Odontomachus brunneus]|uniref:uncharacterized protein LOC116840360 n=2 Tax=Odontomachus brunneus TaxID=486640 RepID=UPI0013F235EE|nr:uncharacterized protein LOC116840360 [Odontomachus brunneus]
MIIGITIGLCIAILTLIYVYCKYVIFNFWRKKGVFYIEPDVPTGNMTDFITGKKSLGEFFYDGYMKYKDHRVFGTYFFLKPNLTITDLDLIQTVLAKEFGSFHDRGLFYNEKTDPLTGNLFMLSGKKWRNLRVKLTPTFTSGKIKQMFMVLKECGEMLTNSLESKIRTEDSIEIKDIFARYSTDIIMTTAFGIKCNSLVETSNEFRYWGKKALVSSAIWDSLFLSIPQIMDFFSRKEYQYKMIIGITIGLCIAILTLIYVYCKYVIFNFWRKKGVFYIEPDVPTGNMTDFITGKKSLGEFFYDGYMKYKDHRVFGTYFFLKPNLTITDLDLIQTVLAKEFGSFHDRGLFYNEKTDPLTGNLFMLSGKKWRNLRVKLTPTFTSGKIKQMFMVLKECGEMLTNSLETAAQAFIFFIAGFETSSTTATFCLYELAIYQDIQEMVRQEIDETLKKHGELTYDAVNQMTYLHKVVQETLRKYPPLPILNRVCTKDVVLPTTNFLIPEGTMITIPVLGVHRDPSIYPDPDKFDPELTKLFQDNVEYRKAHNVVRHDFMNLLIQLMEKGYVESDGNRQDTADISSNTNKFTIPEAAAQAFIFFIAGFETSSTTATFCLYELAIYQDIQEMVRQEIDETLKKHGELTYDAVNQMTYLHKVVQETLRKYPPLPILNRVCTKDVVLPTTNFLIPEGTMITIPVLGVHRDPSIYPDPDKFDPERFNADQVAARHPYAHLAFGEGPRICIGARFGYVQTKVAIISILSKFKFKLHPQTPIPLSIDKSSFLLSVKDGIHLIFEPLFTKLFQDNVEYRKAHNVVRHDFMNLLIQLMEKGYVESDGNRQDTADISSNTNKFTIPEAAAQAFIFFIAGFETSSTTATFCLYELAIYQDIQEMVRQEIDETLKKHGELTYDAVNQMTYLHKVVQETLRKYPPLPILNRVCTKDVVLPTTNVLIPEGTMITIPVLGVHRDPSIYPDPDKFDPERFNVDQVAKRHPYAYLAFGEGPRICIGARFGYVQTKVGIINILSKFKFKLHPQTPIPLSMDKSSFLLSVKDGIHLIFEPL